MTKQGRQKVWNIDFSNFDHLTFQKKTKSRNLSSALRIFEIELKTQVLELKFKLEFLDNNYQNRP